MVGLLEGKIRSLIYQGFKNKLLKGTLYRNVPGGTLDDHGDPITSSPISWSVQGFTDLYSEFYRAQAGIPETDEQMNIFGGSLPVGITPTKDDIVEFRGNFYQLRQMSTDPALALYTGRAFRIPAIGSST